MSDTADDERHDATGAGSDGGDNHDDDDGKANDPLTRTDAEAPKAPFRGDRGPRVGELTSARPGRGAPCSRWACPATGWRVVCRRPGR